MTKETNVTKKKTIPETGGLNDRVNKVLKNALLALKEVEEDEDASMIDVKDAQKVIENTQIAVDCGRYEQLREWLVDLNEAATVYRQVYHSHPRHFWRNARLLTPNLGALKKLKAKRKRLLHVWAKERPGVIRSN